MTKLLGIELKYFLAVILLILLYFSFLLVKPFIIALLGSLLLAYMFNPMYKKLNRHIRNKNVCAFISSVIALLIITIPLIFIANALISDALELYNTVKDTKIEKVIINYVGGGVEVTSTIKDLIDNGLQFVVSEASQFFFKLPQKLISLFIMIFVMFFLFKEGDYFVNRVKDLLPLKQNHKEKLVKKVEEIVDATVFGLLMAALTQGAAALLGFWIFKVPSPILWSFIVAIFAILPLVGPTIVWIPIALVQYLSGDTFNAIGLAIYSLIVLTIVLENLARPLLIKSRTTLHPILIFMGVIGGLKVFGFLGIIIGPMVLALTNLFIEFVMEERWI